MEDDTPVRLTLWVPRQVRQAMKARALECGLTDRGAWLMAVSKWGIEVPPEAIEDRRAARRRTGASE